MHDSPGEDRNEQPTGGFRLDRWLEEIPRALSSHVHVFFLMALGVYLVVLPLVGVTVSAKSELIGGNYTNVASALGASIAAGGTLHLMRQSRRRQHLEEERMRVMHEIHRMLQAVHGAQRSGPTS